MATALIVSTASPVRMLHDDAALRAIIPPEFWQALRADALLHPDAAVPTRVDAG